MKIRFIKNFKTNVLDIPEGAVYDVVEKKSPDLWSTFTRYSIKVVFKGDLQSIPVIVNIPDIYVEELEEA